MVNSQCCYIMASNDGDDDFIFRTVYLENCFLKMLESLKYESEQFLDATDDTLQKYLVNKDVV